MRMRYAQCTAAQESDDEEEDAYAQESDDDEDRETERGREQVC